MSSWLAATLLASVLFAPAAAAQTFFYNEVVKDGRIYVFAIAARYDAFVKADGVGAGPVIERSAYGPNGETVVFDSPTAINLYNFKHGLPGESFPESAASTFPSHRFSGLMFGDYYWYFDRHQDGISSTDPTPVEGQHGLWFRRLYFTYDFSYSETLGTRFRLEANSDGQFEGGDIVPYVKDAYIKWAYKGQQKLTLGIQPTLTFDWLDGFWGLRHIEKTPADLYRLDSSRDFGFTFDGSAATGLTYGVQFGNESGAGSETRQGKILRFVSRYQRSSSLTLEGFYSFGRGPSGADRQTGQGIAGLQSKTVRVGAQYLWQERQSGGDDVAPDQTIGVWSGFVVWDAVPKKADLFLRADFVGGDLGSTETGLPGAEDIDYLLLSSQAPFSMWIGGGEWYLHPAVRFGPNLEIIRYTRDPDPVQLPGRRQDAILRFTFYWTF